MPGLITIFWKELADHFSSKRFIILFLLIYLAGISAIYVAAQTIRSEVTETTEFVFIMLFTTSGGMLPPFFDLSGSFYTDSGHSSRFRCYK